MPIVTGKLTDFGLQDLAFLHPEIVFTPSSAGFSVDTIFITRPVVVPVDGIDFSILLVATDQILGDDDPHYMISIRWLDPHAFGPDRGFQQIDFPDWKLYVPTAGGQIADLIAAPWNPALVWVGPTAPIGTPTTNTFWLDSTTADLKRWAA